MQKGLELNDIYDDMEKYESPKRCLEYNSFELCLFAMSIHNQSVELRKIQEEQGDSNHISVKDYIKTLVKEVCPSYRDLSERDKTLINQLLMNGKEVDIIEDKLTYDLICL